jgi:hypothetical protein
MQLVAIGTLRRVELSACYAEVAVSCDAVPRCGASLRGLHSDVPGRERLQSMSEGDHGIQLF